MPRFILNDESVMNSYGFRIKTAGIDLKRFEANPVMLDGHNTSNLSVIGRWKDIKVEHGKLSADAEFDLEDENAKTISGKVEREIIKGASMGISFSKKNFSYENGELILQKCSLHEASIVAIPSNSGALRLTMDGEELSETDIKAICLSMAQNHEQFKPNDTMKLKLSQLAFIALGFPSQTQEATEEQVNTAVLALEKERNQLKAQLSLSEEKVNAFLEKEKEAQLAATKKLLDEAVASGRITENERQTFADLAAHNFELAKSTLKSIPAKKTFSAGISTPAGTGVVATMEDFQKLSLQEQLAFKEQNPEGYQILLKTI